MKKILSFVIFCFVFNLMIGQESGNINEKLEKLSLTEKGLNNLVQINVSQISLYDFITALSNDHQLNVSVDKSLNQRIINNFHDVKVKDVFSFLVRKYNLDVQILGKIIVVEKRKKEVKKTLQKKIDISYKKNEKLLSLNLNRDSLFTVARLITNKTKENIVLSPEIKNEIVSAFVMDKEIDFALEMIAKSNNLHIAKNKEGYYFITKKPKEIKPAVKKRGKVVNLQRATDNLLIETNSDGTVNILANEVSIIDVIYNLSKEMKKSYFLYSNLNGGDRASFSIKNASYKDVLEHILKGTKFTFKKEGDYFLIGNKTTEGMRMTEVIKMKNRTIENVLKSIPQRIVSELEVKEFIELNALVVTGHFSAISELRAFLTQIDKSVPVVQIEVIIFQYEKSHDIQTGLKAGFDKNQQTSNLASAFPTTDVHLNSNNINKIIDAFNGFGIVNLGKVPSSFFMQLKALENNAIIDLESTPKVATLNGHEASLKIGATDYYFEQTNQLLNGNNNNNDNILQSGRWKPTEANLSLKIKPFVSQDESVTLEVRVEKSSFTGRVGETAPPSKSTQQFESFIRVKNGDMILLGGLDEAEKSNSGTGTPFLSRIPIIKWFFSGRKKKKAKKKLHMFIKPTVFYQ
ncbi:type II and III secretion system protein [Tenacibaculum xiamenense]|uniref:type II and III secretion system protein n=1 Tax=Tenacibaculum xiamenense TaxID=1261553 RepID=UPI003894114F